MADIASDLQTTVEGLRSEELWERVDTYCVGFDAQRRSVSWDNNFLGMGSRDLITFFDGSRTKSVGKAHCNLSGATEDWGQEVYQSGIEFIAPIGQLSQVTNANDALFFPSFWTAELPHLMSVTIKLQDTDEVLLIPMSHMPGGTGVSGVVMDGAASAIVQPGSSGPGSLKMTFDWPKPLIIPSKKKMVMECTLDSPAKEFFLGLPDTVPGVATMVNNDALGQPIQTTRKLWYRIRCWHRGPRRVQLRSAYSS